MCCAVLLRRVARHKDRIAELRKKKDVKTTECFECVAVEERCKCMHEKEIDERREEADNLRGIIKNLTDKTSKFQDEVTKLQFETLNLKNEAKIDKVRMDAKVEEITRLDTQNTFYQSRIFASQNTAHVATPRQDSISMMGGVGNRGFSPAAYTPSPDG